MRRLRNQAHVAMRLAARLVILRESTSSPAYSPCDPAFGCSDTAAKPVISASARSSSSEQLADSPSPAPPARTDAACRTPATSPGTSPPSRSASSCSAERDHRVRQRQIARLERAHVAQHLRLGVVRVEHRVREERRRAREPLVVPRRPPRRPARSSPAPAAPPAKTASSSCTSSVGHRLVERDDRRASSPRARRLIPRSAAAAITSSAVRSAELDAQRVEVVVVRQRVAELLEPRRERRRVPVDAPRDRREPLRRRATRRTCSPSPRAAPAPCRRCSSPSRGGCAARASAAPCAARAGRSRRGHADDAARAACA